MLRFGHASNILATVATRLPEFTSGPPCCKRVHSIPGWGRGSSIGSKESSFVQNDIEKKGTHGSRSISGGSRPDHPPGGIAQRSHHPDGADGPHPLSVYGDLAEGRVTQRG